MPRVALKRLLFVLHFIGLNFLFGLLFGWFRQRSALGELRREAPRLGLEPVINGTSLDASFSLSGKTGGHRVFVEGYGGNPSRAGTYVTVQLNRKAPKLALATYSPLSTFPLERADDEAMARFETGHPRFEAGFTHRFAAPEGAVALCASPALLDRCATLWEHWWLSLKEASITTLGGTLSIEARFDDGLPIFPRIGAAKLEAVLKDLVAIADALIDAFGGPLSPEVIALSKELMTAAASGDVPRAQALLEQGARVDYEDDHFATPLHKAAGPGGNAEMVALLLGAGAHDDVKDLGGLTPLMTAIHPHADPNTVAQLLDTENAFDNTEGVDSAGRPALVLAIRHDLPAIVALLLEANASPLWVEDRGGKTGWDYAEHKPAIQKLLENEGYEP